MSILTTDKTLPGISQLFRYDEKLAVPMLSLVQQLLRGESPLTIGFREQIAATVSYFNEVEFCLLTHGYAASILLGKDVVAELRDPAYYDMMSNLSPETMTLEQYLLAVAAAVGGPGDGLYGLTPSAVKMAISVGGTEKHIHDAVAIASAFAMYNRYMKGLSIECPTELVCHEIGARIAREGYIHQSKIIV